MRDGHPLSQVVTPGCPSARTRTERLIAETEAQLARRPVLPIYIGLTDRLAKLHAILAREEAEPPPPSPLTYGQGG